MLEFNRGSCSLYVISDPPKMVCSIYGARRHTKRCGTIQKKQDTKLMIEYCLQSVNCKKNQPRILSFNKYDIIEIWMIIVRHLSRPTATKKKLIEKPFKQNDCLTGFISQAKLYYASDLGNVQDQSFTIVLQRRPCQTVFRTKPFVAVSSAASLCH